MTDLINIYNRILQTVNSFPNTYSDLDIAEELTRLRKRDRFLTTSLMHVFSDIEDQIANIRALAVYIQNTTQQITDLKNLLQTINEQYRALSSIESQLSVKSQDALKLNLIYDEINEDSIEKVKDALETESVFRYWLSKTLGIPPSTFFELLSSQYGNTTAEQLKQIINEALNEAKKETEGENEQGQEQEETQSE
jgi:hypothetical protein